ncbi:MAG: helix-turn-helix domain-containing protein [Anaerolineae bacterium]|nr:helix-turn-helix domain-containing protein [Anaerolineae bacterium]
MTPRQRAELNIFGLSVWSGSVNTLYPPHRHNEVELNAIERGHFTYMLAGQETTVAAGEVALFWGAIPHQVIEYAPGTQLHWGTVPLDYVLGWELPRSFVDALLGGDWFRDPNPYYDQRFFARWQTDLQAGQPAIALMEMRAMFFRFAQLPHSAHAAGSAPYAEGRQGRANTMAAYMSGHFQEALTVADIARTVNLQPNYAMSVFKAAFGMSLIEYLTQQRIAHAQQLLIMSDASVAEIALDSGFQTVSHFYNAFSRLCGVSPGRYRAALRG